MRPALAHILYIDDDDGMRRLASRALGRKGYEVSLAASGGEGVDMAKVTAFDLVCRLLLEKKKDGLATLEALRALRDCPPVVYVTGSE